MVSEHQLRLGFELSPVGMAIVARDGRITRANAALGELVARGPRSLMGVPFESLVHPDDLSSFRGDADGMLDGAGPVRSRALRLVRPDGTTAHVAADMVLVSETADEPQFFSLQLRDTTSEARREGLDIARVAIRDRIDQGQPVQGTLDEICRMVESQLDWALGAVMRVRAGMLELTSGERLPPLLESALRSVEIDPSGVPCARAAARGTNPSCWPTSVPRPRLAACPACPPSESAPGAHGPLRTRPAMSSPPWRRFAPSLSP